jgi:predicted DNA-binding antitoxin AbrB/MazE fold protein
MGQEFDAIYERGVFRPLEPVELAEQTKVHLQIQEAASVRRSPADEAAAQRAALRELVDWVHRQPSSAAESCSARDHDRLLYGRDK